ncbi:MAG: hypothetical protein AABX61_01030 [Nanoarchaeota archaeon]
MKRYYNLKKDNPDIIGHLIEVDFDAKLEDKVKCFTTKEKPIFLTSHLDENFYNIDFEQGAIGIRISKNRNVGVYNLPKNSLIYFCEIDEELFNKLKRGYKEFISTGTFV